MHLLQKETNCNKM